MRCTSRMVAALDVCRRGWQHEQGRRRTTAPRVTNGDSVSVGIVELLHRIAMDRHPTRGSTRLASISRSRRMPCSWLVEGLVPWCPGSLNEARAHDGASSNRAESGYVQGCYRLTDRLTPFGRFKYCHADGQRASYVETTVEIDESQRHGQSVRLHQDRWYRRVQFRGQLSVPTTRSLCPRFPSTF